MLKNMQRITSFARYAVRWLLMFTISFFALGVAMILTTILLPFAVLVTKKRTERNQERLEGNYYESRGNVGYEVDFSGEDGQERVTGTTICHTECEMSARMEVIEMFGFLENFKIDEVRSESY